MKLDLKKTNLQFLKFNLDIPQEMIAQRARDIYDESGHVEGRDKENWEQAIEDIKRAWYQQVQKSLFHNERDERGRFVVKSLVPNNQLKTYKLNRPITSKPVELTKQEEPEELEFAETPATAPTLSTAPNVPIGVSRPPLWINMNYDPNVFKPSNPEESFPSSGNTGHVS